MDPGKWPVRVLANEFLTREIDVALTEGEVRDLNVDMVAADVGKDPKLTDQAAPRIEDSQKGQTRQASLAWWAILLGTGALVIWALTRGILSRRLATVLAPQGNAAVLGSVPLPHAAATRPQPGPNTSTVSGRDEQSLLFSLGNLLVKPDSSVGPTLSGVLPPGLSTVDLEKLRNDVMQGLEHDLALWRQRRSRLKSKLVLPTMLDPAGPAILVALTVALPALHLSNDTSEKLRTFLGYPGALLTVVNIVHRFTRDPQGSKRAYIGRLDRMINMIEGWMAELHAAETIERKEIERVLRMARYAHVILRPHVSEL